MAVWAYVGPEPIDPAAVLARVGDPGHGAAVLFLGTVRDHAEGRTVSGMTYEAYASMATSELAALAGETAERWATGALAVAHRTGALAVGEVSVAIAVSTAHRAEAFEAARHVIEEIKVRLPVWKHEHFVDGESRWVPGRTPPATAPETA